jgi:hypothetical protein
MKSWKRFLLVLLSITEREGWLVQCPPTQACSTTRESVSWVDQLSVDLECPMSQGSCRLLSLAVTARAHRRVGALTTRSAT